MIPINNSDTAWLIITDYNQENSLPYEDLREDILNPEINQWAWEARSCYHDGKGRVGGGSNPDVDGSMNVGINKNHSYCDSIGWAFNNNGILVGGNSERQHDTNQPF